MARRIPKEQIALLRAVPMFAKFSDRELEHIDALVDEIEVPAGEVLTRQGAVDARQSFVIVEGTASVEIDGRTVATLGAGALFGEMAMLDHKPRTATVTAVTPMRLLLIGPASFPSFVSQPGIALPLMSSLVARLRTVEAGASVREAAVEYGAA
jgi:CRP-like cAMP-binding protein